jgi:hypothetical protein
MRSSSMRGAIGGSALKTGQQISRFGKAGADVMNYASIDEPSSKCPSDLVV